MALDDQTIVSFHRYWFCPQKVENVELVDMTGMQDFFKNNATLNLCDSHVIPLSNDVYSKNRNEMMNIRISYFIC